MKVVFDQGKDDATLFSSMGLSGPTSYPIIRHSSVDSIFSLSLYLKVDWH